MPRRTSTVLRVVAAMAAAVIALSGCALGQRPMLAGAPKGTGNAEVDRLLAQLEAPDHESFTARYHAVRMLGSVQSDAMVVHVPGATSVTINNWRFIRDQQQSTCSLSAHTCETGIRPQRVTDTGLTDEFWALAPARQIRVGSARQVRPPTISQRVVATVNSTCLTLSVAGGDEVYCVAPNGIVTSVKRGDITIEMTSYQPKAEGSAFAPS